MNIKNIKHKISDTLNIIEDIDEKYRIAAFKIVLNHLLNIEDIHYQNNKSPIAVDELNNFRGLSLREILLMTGIRNHAENALIVGYYLLSNNITLNFNSTFIIEELDKAMLDKPKNMPDTLNLLIKKGFLEITNPVDDMKGFKLTITGVKFVEDLIADSKAS